MMTANMKKLIKLVDLRSEILELLPYKANVYPWDPATGLWGDGSLMHHCKRQIEQLREMGYNKNRRKALKQVEREMVELYNYMVHKGEIKKGAK